VRTLRFISGPQAGEAREIVGELVLGRESADVALSDEEASRQHVALRAVSEGVELEDLGSRNGTFVDERRVQGKVTLTSSATLRVGQTRFKIDIALPQVTKLHRPEAPSPLEDTEGQPLASPDVTVQRAILSPQATAKLPAVSSDPAVDEPIAAPDATVQRPIAAPDATVQPPIAAPDATVQRPIASPDAASRRPVVQPPPPQAPARPGPQRGLKPWLPWIFGGLILVVALAVILSLILK